MQRFAVRRGAQFAGQSILSGALGGARGPALRRGAGAQVRFAGALTEGTLLGWLGLHVVNLTPATRRELHRIPEIIIREAFRPPAACGWAAGTLKVIGAGEGIRTLDPDLGKVVLYH